MTKEQLKKFRKKLLIWFQKNKRNLPWRENPDWYKTYLSEVILQQTTIDQGLPYFKKFLNTFPSIKKIANADEQHVLQLWAGLGYYSRARNLLKAAKVIVQNYNACFPDEYKEALKIPGIGPYSASAILSIAFGKPYAAIDGNVTRVVSRLFAIKGDIRESKTMIRVRKKTEMLLDSENPGDFNEATMELGATVCKPSNPKCKDCPVHYFCKAFANNLVEKIPLKSQAKAKQKKYQIVCILKNNSRILIGRKPQKGLLAGMWELPVIDVDQKQFDNGYSTILKKKNIRPKLESVIFRHIYSHIDLKFKAVVAQAEIRYDSFHQYVDHKWIVLNDIENYAIHNAHKKIFEWYNNEIRN